MPAHKSLHVAVADELAERLRDTVSSGEFISEGDAVEEALRGWFARRDLGEAGALWRAGLDSGSGRFETIDEIMAEGRRRLLEEQRRR